MRALGRFVEQGWSTKARSRCTGASTAGPRWPRPRSSTRTTFAVDLRRVSAGAGSARELAARVPALAGRAVSVLIWTTTPWTIPSNLAVAFHPEFDYGAYDVDGRRGDRGRRRSPHASAADRSAAHSIAGGPDEWRGARGAPLQASAVRPGLASASWPTTSRSMQGTGAVHTAPGHGSRRLPTGVKYGLEIYAPVGPGRALQRQCRPVRRTCGCSTRIRTSKKRSPPRGRLWHRETFKHSYPHCWRCNNPVIFLATSQWFIRMDGQMRCATAPAPLRCGATRSTQVSWLPAWGRRAHPQHARAPPRLVHLAATDVGRPDSGGHLHGMRRSRADDGACRPRGRTCSRKRRRCLVRPADRRFPAGRTRVPGLRRHDLRARARHPRRLVRLRRQP